MNEAELDAVIASQTQAIQNLRSLVIDLKASLTYARDDVERFAAENAKLREAMKKLIVWFDSDSKTEAPLKLARAALKETT